jgi:hypothetical protein
MLTNALIYLAHYFIALITKHDHDYDHILLVITSNDVYYILYYAVRN